MSRHCLLEGTNILLINGIEKKIEELKVDDELIVYEIKNMKNTQNIEILKIQKEDKQSLKIEQKH